MARLLLIGERSRTLVGASFHDGWSAERAATLLDRLVRAQADVAVIRPGDKNPARKIEPDDDGVWRTLVRSHLVLGTGGTIAGAACAGMLILASPAVASSTGYAMFFLSIIGAFFGVMAATFVTLRPDHDRVIQYVRAQQKRGRWIVVAHPAGESEARDAVAALRAAGGGPKRSL